MVSLMDISVIIPVYNVEAEYLRASLESLLTQTKRDNVEIIIVDDGSTNGNGAVADEYASENSNITVLHVENGGPGRARNIGISHAAGEYLAFLDSDDLLPEDTLEKMYSRAVHDSSDVVIVNTVRFDGSKESQASIHTITFRDLENVTDARQSPELIYDTISCNKLIRRDFWKANGLSYPEENIYEDIPVMTEVMLKANKVSVIRSLGYKWRFRELESRSITQKREQLSNLRARLDMLKKLDKVYSEEIDDPGLILEKQIKALRVDLKIYVNVCPDLTPEQAGVYMREMGDYIRENISDEAMQRINPVDRLIYEALLNEDLDRLIRLVDFRRKEYNDCINIEKDGTMLMSVPPDLFGCEYLDITESLADRFPAASIIDVQRKRNKIRITGNLFFYKINIPDPSMQEIRASLCDEYAGEEYELPVTYFSNHDLTERKGLFTDARTGESIEYNYDGTGFYIDLDPQLTDKDIRNGVIVLRYRNRFVKGIILLRNKNGKTKKKLEAVRLISDKTVCSLSASEMQILKVNIQKNATVTLHDRIKSAWHSIR